MVLDYFSFLIKALLEMNLFFLLAISVYLSSGVPFLFPLSPISDIPSSREMGEEMCFIRPFLIELR